MDRRTDDEKLRDAVLEALDRDQLLDVSQLDVDVDDGVITLVGTVGSVAQKLAAQSIAEMVSGVRDVLSLIDIKVPTGVQRSDEALDDIIGQVLAWDALVPEKRVTHRVSNAWVTLAGKAATRSQAREAERAVSRLLGIRGVTNDIELDEPMLTPSAVREAVDRALVRRAVHRADKIDIIVDDGEVVLRGTVESIGQKQAVHNAVGHLPGVDVLCDELHVRDPVR